MTSRGAEDGHSCCFMLKCPTRSTKKCTSGTNAIKKIVVWYNFSNFELSGLLVEVTTFIQSKHAGGSSIGYVYFDRASEIPFEHLLVMRGTLWTVCLRWAVTNRQRLLDLNSSLEFKLHRLYFISLLGGGINNQMEALQYARHFQPFASQHQRGRAQAASL